MPASIAFCATAVSALPSKGRITSELTFLAMSVSIEEICLVTSLVASTGSYVTSEYFLAWVSAFLLIAAIQPWSPCGPEKPIVTSLPGAALSPAGAAAWPLFSAAGVSGSLLVQAARTAPAPTTPPTARKRRRSRPAERRSVMKVLLLNRWLSGGLVVSSGSGGTVDPAGRPHPGC